MRPLHQRWRAGLDCPAPFLQPLPPAPGPEPPSEQCNVKEGRSLQGRRPDAQLPESTDLTQAIYMLLLAFSPPYLINKVFLSSAACGELRVNWARPGKASQKLGCPPEPRRAAAGLLNSPEKHLGPVLRPRPCWPLYLSAPKNIPGMAHGFTSPSALSLAETSGC
ncbi:hypothetical protein Celaphus_00015365, partial [Cervus elaphus hippelaphus]